MKRRYVKTTSKLLTGLLACSLAVVPFPATAKTDVPEDWTLVWQDEFNGTALDPTKWVYDTGNAIVDENGNFVASGWGNEELEYYTAGDNLQLDGENLVITAKKEQVSDPYGTYDYTSSRIKTKGNFTKKYGRIEASMKLPTGDGLWPAFWMLPEDDVYGGWAASGEIDIMEARGRIPSEVEGTLHYGGVWPQNRYSGAHYTFPEGETIADFHEYAIEWEPGEIRWYVDDVLYQTQNNWHATDPITGEKYAFGAPFDQDFHILLNLAVGGWFDNGAKPGEDFTEAEMLVDYVRVYDLTGRPYQEIQEPVVEKAPIPETAKPEISGSYVYDATFASGFTYVTQHADLFDPENWNFVTLPDFGGVATASVVDNYARFEFQNGGIQSYATQLIQHVPLVQGHTYKLTYDAKADSNRTMVVKASGGADRGWTTYSEAYEVALTPEMQSYEHIFTMNHDNDLAARLEFNMGLQTSAITLGNVRLERTEPVVDYDGPKAPLLNGNHVYNGAFDKGTIDRLTYWNLEGETKKATASVAEQTRELKMSVKKTKSLADIQMTQKGLQLKPEANYQFNFATRAEAKKAKSLMAVIKNVAGEQVYTTEVPLTATMTTHQFDFMTPAGNPNELYTLSFMFGGEAGDVYLDQVELFNTDLPEIGFLNGDFSQGLTNWKAWSWQKYDDFINDIIVTDGQAHIAIPTLAATDESWAVQMKQTLLNVQKDVQYTVSVELAADIERELELVIQNSSYERFLSEKITLSATPQTYTFTFVAPKTEQVELNFLLGQYGGAMPAHTVTMDNVQFAITQ